MGDLFRGRFRAVVVAVENHTNRNSKLKWPALALFAVKYRQIAPKLVQTLRFRYADGPMAECLLYPKAVIHIIEFWAK